MCRLCKCCRSVTNYVDSNAILEFILSLKLYDVEYIAFIYVQTSVYVCIQVRKSLCVMFCFVMYSIGCGCGCVCVKVRMYYTYVRVNESVCVRGSGGGRVEGRGAMKPE